jgi:hypothetical protein
MKPNPLSITVACEARWVIRPVLVEIVDPE